MTDALIMRAQSMIESTLSDRLDLRDTAILLVGSRAHARASETSDWDLLALASDNPPRETIELPRGEIELLGRDGRRARATVDLPIWQFELSHALLVHDGWADAGLDESARDDHEGYWIGYLEDLAAVLEEAG